MNLFKIIKLKFKYLNIWANLVPLIRSSYVKLLWINYAHISKENKNALVNWHFSVWRESSYRQKIDEWESFLRNKYLTNTYDIFHLTDPIQVIKNNKDILLELEKLLENAAGRVNASGEIRETAKNLIVEIKEYINKT